MTEGAAAKFCPYCGASHGRRARACSDYCERRIRASKASATMGRNRAVKRIVAAKQKERRNVGKWRSVAMGRDVASNLQAIFGDAARRLFEP